MRCCSLEVPRLIQFDKATFHKVWVMFCQCNRTEKRIGGWDDNEVSVGYSGACSNYLPQHNFVEAARQVDVICVNG